MKLRCFFSVVLFIFSAASLAQSRAIPVEARRAKIAPIDTSTLLVNKKPVHLLAGARIYDENNRTIRPGRVPENVLARVRYNDRSEIRDVWILTPEEIAQKDPDPNDTRRPGVPPKF